MDFKLVFVLCCNFGLISCIVPPNPVGSKSAPAAPLAAQPTAISTTNANNANSPQINLDTFAKLLAMFNMNHQVPAVQQQLGGNKQNQMPGMQNMQVPNTNIPLSAQNSLNQQNQLDPYFINGNIPGSQFSHAGYFHVNNHISHFEGILRPSYGLDVEQKRKLLEEHNKYRADVAHSEASNMNVLRWSDALAAKAIMEVANCSYINRGNGASMGIVHEKKYGTSLVSELVGRWGDEKNRFSLGQNCAISRTCRYSQLIWAETKEVGCGVKICGDMSFVACMYSPPGNILTNIGGRAVPQAAYERGPACSTCVVPPKMTERCNSDFLCEWY